MTNTTGKGENNPFDLGTPAVTGYEMTNANTQSTNKWTEEFKKWMSDVEEEDFDTKRYPNLIYNIADWWLSKISTLLIELEKEVEGMKRELPKAPCINAEMHTFGQCFACEKTKGFNDCLSQVLELIKLKKRE